MSSIVLSGNTSGSITVSVPDVAGTNTVTIPAVTGTCMVSGNMPAFSVYNNAGQSISTSANVKLTYDTEEFDTNSNFSSNRFTPTVSGYYQINAQVSFNPLTANNILIYLFKNGSEYKRGGRFKAGPSQATYTTISSVVYCNGTTDYLEIYVYQDSGGAISTENGNTTASNYFNGCLVRSA